jgi:hypothetical protein
MLPHLKPKATGDLGKLKPSSFTPRGNFVERSGNIRRRRSVQLVKQLSQLLLGQRLIRCKQRTLKNFN